MRLGPYEVVGALGAGGMGEVYRATDTRLDRTVAIKVLPAHVAADSALRERFEREARAVGGLSHPNICTLHDIGRQRPASGGPPADESAPPVDFLVMECLDGETLARRLERGALPPDEALGIAGDVAEAIDAAHRQGIVHRDLKPGNVMLTSTGVKLLDFGLARLRARDALDDDPSAAPTRAALTAEGSLLGTLQYMSPEQLDGKPVDARSDIFAFGATLYEMLTGARPFDGDSQASVIGSILKDDPAPLREVRPGLPRRLERLVATCLAKDPDDRWQTVRDLKRELRWLAQTGGDADEPEQAASAPAGGSGVAGWRLVLPVVAAGLVAAAAWTLKPAPTPPPATVERFVIEVGEGQELDVALALSPDGRRLVYRVVEDGTTRLYLRDLDAFEPVPIAGTEGLDAVQPFFSPDGRDIGFGRIEAGENRTLNRIPAAGGRSVEIARLAGQLAGAVWRPDGTIVMGVLGSGLVSVPATGGEAQSLTRLSDRPGDLAHGGPIAVPGREEILFQIISGTMVDQRSQAAIYAPDGTVRVLGEVSGSGSYVETGHWVYTAPGGALMARPLDLDAGAFAGEPFQVPFDDSDSLRPVVNQSIRGATNAFIRQPDGGVLRTLTWVDRAGNEEPLPLEPAEYRVARLSPDGRRIALDRGRPNERDLWVFDLERDTLSPLFLGPGDDESPVWTPDGRQIVFTSGPDDEANLHLRAADGTGPVERLSASGDFQWPQSWSPDGRTLVFSRRVRTGPAAAQTLDTMMMRLDADRAVAPLLVTDFTESNPAVSPDGGWLAYRSDESGRNEVYVQRFPEMGGRVQISTAGGTSPLWSSDGTELYYRQGAAMMAVGVDGTGDAFSAGPPERLFEGRYLDDLTRNYDIGPDGRFLMIKQTGTLRRIHVVVNWMEELRPFLESS